MVSKLLFKNVFQSQIKPKIEEVILRQYFFVVVVWLAVFLVGFVCLVCFSFTILTLHIYFILFWL